MHLVSDFWLKKRHVKPVSLLIYAYIGWWLKKTSPVYEYLATVPFKKMWIILRYGLENVVKNKNPEFSEIQFDKISKISKSNTHYFIAKWSSQLKSINGVNMVLAALEKWDKTMAKKRNDPVQATKTKKCEYVKF